MIIFISFFISIIGLISEGFYGMFVYGLISYVVLWLATTFLMILIGYNVKK